MRVERGAAKSKVFFVASGRQPYGLVADGLLVMAMLAGSE